MEDQNNYEKYTSIVVEGFSSDVIFAMDLRSYLSSLVDQDPSTNSLLTKDLPDNASYLTNWLNKPAKYAWHGK